MPFLFQTQAFSFSDAAKDIKHAIVGNLQESKMVDPQKINLIVKPDNSLEIRIPIEKGRLPKDEEKFVSSLEGIVEQLLGKTPYPFKIDRMRMLPTFSPLSGGGKEVLITLKSGEER